MINPRTSEQFYWKNATIRLPFEQCKQNILETYSHHPFVSILHMDDNEIELAFHIAYHAGEIIVARATITEDNYFYGYPATVVSYIYKREITLFGYAEMLLLQRACLIYWMISLLVIGYVIDVHLLLRIIFVGVPFLSCLLLLIFGDIYDDSYVEFRESKLYEKLRGSLSSLLWTLSSGDGTKINVWD